MEIPSYIQMLAKQLAEDGYNLIKNAYAMSNYNKDQTQNLHDSYGSAVFYKGRLYPGTKRYFSKLASKPRYNKYTGENEYGRDEIDKFFDSYKPDNKGMQLVTVVTMFYAGILEGGKYPLKRKYKVIFMIGDDVQKLVKKIKGARMLKIERGEVNAL